MTFETQMSLTVFKPEDEKFNINKDIKQNNNADIMKKYVDGSWNFARADTKYYTHGIHSYPAMMIPQVAKRIIDENGTDAKIGLDPFCGSGSVLLEFELGGINNYGLDINPLAILISKVKTSRLSPAKLKVVWQKLKTQIRDNNSKNVAEVPNFFNIDFWFKRDIIKQLEGIRLAILDVEDEELRNFFLVCFSEAVRRCSNTKGGEFKLVRISKDKLENHNPRPYKVFHEIVERNILSMSSLYNISKNKTLGKSSVVLTDTAKEIKIPKNSVDIMVTSPPYGDSRTTVAYGQYSRLSLQWLGFSEEIKSLDKNMLGGKPTPDLNFSFSSPTLDKMVRLIAEKDDLRARDVLSFFVDFHKAAKNISNIMKDNSRLCIVVGNRTVKGLKIPSDEIMAEIFEDFDYIHSKTFVRSIPSKRMPKVNSPTNVKGKTLSTMNEENIVLLER